MERYRSGHNGADPKSVCEQSHMGSNPILSAKKSSKLKGLLDFSFFLPTCLFCKKYGKNSSFLTCFYTFARTDTAENPCAIKLFGACSGFLQELGLPSGSLTDRKNKDVVHYICGSYLGFVVQMTVNIRCCADIAVAEPFLYLLHRNIVGKK